MPSASPSELFNANTAAAYDERSRRIGAIREHLDLLIHLVLSPLPDNARVLCVGIGTGTELLALAARHPGWSFTGVEPAEAMLAICQRKVADAGLDDRVELIHGYVDDVPLPGRFDAALCLLVSQFVLDPDARTGLFRAIHDRLVPGGLCINAEISGDPDSPVYADLMGVWQAMHAAAGAPPENLAAIPANLRKHVAVIPPDAIEALLRAAGFAQPVRFLQSLFIHGWYARR